MVANNPIEHIVLYSFSKHEELATAMEFIKGLAMTARRDGKVYVQSIKCGTTRPSGKIRSLGFNLASVFTFASDEDRLYFVKEDPAHQELVKFVSGKMAKDILVLDFVDGEADVDMKVDDC